MRKWILDYPWRFLFVCLALYCLTGCLGHSTRETGSVAGIVAGQPVAITWKRDSEGHTTVEIPPALLDGLKVGANATPWGPLVAGGISVVAAAVAAHRDASARAAAQRAEEHKADAAEGWAKATDG